MNALRVVEGTATSDDGVSIWYHAVGGGAPGTQTVLVMHGGPGLGSTYLRGLEALATPTRRIVRLDQRGVGGSSKPTDSNYHMDRILEDVDAVLSELRAETFTFIGHSWGGLVAMEYAVHSPNRLEALVLLASMMPTSIGNTSFQIRQERIQKLQSEGLIPLEVPDQVTDVCGWVAAVLPVYFGDPHFVPPPELTQNACDQTTARLTWDQFPKPYDLRPELAALHIPAFVVMGELDWLVGAAQPTAAAFDPDAPIAMIPGVGHFPWIEAPGSTLPVLRSFLNEHE